MTPKAVVFPRGQVIYGDFRPQVSEVSSEWRPGNIRGNGNDGGGNDMESRLSVLEEKNKNIESNIGDIRTNIRYILVGSITVLLAIGAGYYGLKDNLHSLDLNLTKLDSKVDLHSVENKARFTSIDEDLKSMKHDLKSIQSNLEKLTKDK